MASPHDPQLDVARPAGASQSRGTRRRRPRSPLARTLSQRGESLVVGLHLAAIVGAAHALGAMHVWVLLPVAALVLIACAICYRARLVPAWNVPPPAKVCVGLAAYTAFQAAPLPIAVVEALSPATAETWSGALSPLQQTGPSWASLSLDPGASWLEALKWFVYAAAFATSAALGARKGAAWGALAVFVSGVSIALSSLGHRLSGASTVYGVYEPVGEFAREKIGPLLNPNNLSGYLNVAVFCGLGLLIMRRPPLPRFVLALGVAFMLGALLDAASRGGLAAFGLGLIAFLAALAYAQRRADATIADRTTSRVVVAVAVTFGVALAVLAASRNLTSILQERNVEKIRLLSWARPMLVEHPWFGIGRGAFESVFPAYRTGPANVIYSHPENFVAQWVTEWGAPVALIGLALFVRTLRPKAVGLGREAAAVGVVVALFVLLAQNLVDLGLEVPAIPLAAATCLGACWGAAHLSEVGRDERRSSRRAPVRIAWATVLLGAALLGAGTLLGTHSVGDDRLRVAEQLAAADLKVQSSRDELRASLGRAMLRHPAEPYFPRIGGYVAWRVGDENPLPWVERALERGLSNGRTHYLLARILGSGGKVSQAILEGRLAVEYDPSLVKPVAALALKITPDAEQLVRVIPQGTPAPMIAALLQLTRQDPSFTNRDGLLKVLGDRYPTVLEPQLALVTDLIDALQGRRNAARCPAKRRTECVREAESALERADKLSSGGGAALELRAELLIITDRAEQASQLLRGRCERLTNPKRCKRLQLRAATLTKSAATVAETTRSIIATGCETPAACAESFESVGDTMAASDSWDQARNYYSRAVKEDATSERWLKLAGAAARTGAHLEAADAYQRVLRERGPDPALEAKLRRERDAALRSRFRIP